MQKIIVEQGGLTKELSVENNYSTNGWTAIFANVADGARVVQKIIDLVGGTGTKPSSVINKYMGASGLVSNIADATNIKGADGSSTNITVNNIAAVDDNITLTAADVGADAEGEAAQALEDANAYTDDGLALKLDAADYVQHFLGKYASLLALETAHATANDGDYAIVDTGIGADARQYVWDVDDGWVDSGEVKSGTTTDQITEGSSNLYFTSSRVRDVVLTGLSLVTGTAITALDTVLGAFGKLQKQINDLFSNQRYVIETDASATYTVPSSAVTENGRTIVELSNNSLTSITVNAATATDKTAGDSVTIEITGTYAAQTLVADGVTLNGTAAFSANAKIKTLIYRGSNTWKVMGG